MAFFYVELPENNQYWDVDSCALLNAMKDTYNVAVKTTPNYFNSLTDVEIMDKKLKDQLLHCAPVGSIDFVQSYLSVIHGITKMNPIEIPDGLRIEKMLMREYHIVPWEGIPTEGYWFVKDVSGLKYGSYCGNVKRNPFTNKEHIYQVSSVLDIISEYRVFVSENKIVGIQYYDGDVCIMPTENEIRKIKEAVARYSAAKDCPDAYSMDWAIIKTTQDRDIALLEIHPFAALGLYGLEGPILPKMYRDGLQWYIKYNTKLGID